jgi:hypothetical protein
MKGVLGMLRVGGWFVITEFGKFEGGEDVAGQYRIKLEEAKVCLYSIRSYSTGIGGS